MPAIHSNHRIKLSSIRLRSPDSDDQQVWVQSSIGATVRLPRGAREDFSLTRDALTMISNRGGGIATVMIDCLSAGESGLYIGSNRRAGTPLREGETLKLRLRAGEVLTLRSLDALEPRSGVEIRPGQSVAL